MKMRLVTFIFVALLFSLLVLNPQRAYALYTCSSSGSSIPAGEYAGSCPDGRGFIIYCYQPCGTPGNQCYSAPSCDNFDCRTAPGPDQCAGRTAAGCPNSCPGSLQCNQGTGSLDPGGNCFTDCSACLPPCPTSTAEISYGCFSVSGVGSVPTSWTYETNYSCGFGSNQTCFSRPVQASSGFSISGQAKKCSDQALMSGSGSSVTFQLSTTNSNLGYQSGSSYSYSNLASGTYRLSVGAPLSSFDGPFSDSGCSTRQQDYDLVVSGSSISKDFYFKAIDPLPPSCSCTGWDSCPSCGNSLAYTCIQHRTCTGTTADSCQNVPTSQSLAMPLCPTSPSIDGTCSISVSIGGSSGTGTSVTATTTFNGNFATGNYNRINFFKGSGTNTSQLLGTKCPVADSGCSNTGTSSTSTGLGAGTYTYGAVWYSTTGPGNPTNKCTVSFTIPTTTSPGGGTGGGLTCCHIPGNIGRWSTDYTCPGGAAVTANFNTSGSSRRNGNGCFREDKPAYAPQSNQVGGNAWVVDAAGNMSRPNFGHYFYWINSPPGQNLCILNTSYSGGDANQNSGSACISAYPNTWGYTANGGDGWGEYETQDAGMLYRHRTPSGGDSGVDKRFVLLDWDHSVDPIGFLTYTAVYGTRDCPENEPCHYQRCEPFSERQDSTGNNWPTNRAKFYTWNSNLSSSEAGTATVNDSGDGSSHTGTLQLRSDLVSNGTNIGDLGSYAGSTLFCTVDPNYKQTGEMGYVLGNARIDPVFRKQLQPPGEFSLTAAAACLGESSPYIQLSWTYSPGVESYLVYRQSDSETTPTRIATLPSSQTEYSDYGGSSINQNYHYFVQAQNTDGCTRNDTSSGSCSGGGGSGAVSWVSLNSGYCDSQKPIILGIDRSLTCVIPNPAPPNSHIDTSLLWSQINPITVRVQDPSPGSGVGAVGYHLQNNLITPPSNLDPAVTQLVDVTYPDSTQSTTSGASQLFNIPIPATDLSKIAWPNNHYTLRLQARDRAGNPSTPQYYTFTTDNACKCPTLSTLGGDVHANQAIDINCGK